jgi:tetratricopeptide (TPR) repeat protein
MAMTKRCLSALLLAAIVLSGSQARAGDWLRVRSPHFTIEGDVGARDLRELARRLEKFRDVVGRDLPPARLATPTPVLVLVFASGRDFRRVAPLYDGKPVDIEGFAVASSVGASIAISVGRDTAPYPVVYHEYAHLLVSNGLPGAPLWLQEGLAEYYRAFELSGDGRQAILGKPVVGRQFSRLPGRLLRMSDLLAIDETSKLYNVGQDRNRFYAQCWLLVHYLRHADAARGAQFKDYISRLAARQPAGAAFSEAFPRADELGSELAIYIERLARQPIQYLFVDCGAGQAEYPASRMTPADAIASAGHVLMQQSRYSEAEGCFNRALDMDRETASAHTGVGIVRMTQERLAEAFGPLREGARLDERNPMAQFALGFAAYRCLSSHGCFEPNVAQTARAALARAVELGPEFPDALAYLGSAELANGAALAQAQRHLESAVALLPGRDDYRLRLAQVFMRQGEFVKARAMIEPIAATSPDPAQREAARQLLGELPERIR